MGVGGRAFRGVIYGRGMFFALLASIGVALPAIAADVPALSLHLEGSLSTDSARMLAGMAKQVSASRGRADVTHTVRQWSSSKPGVATIDDAGRVTALSIGTTTITASISPPVTGSLVVTVTSLAAPAFAVQPANAFVSAPIGPAVQVRVRDVLGDAVPGLAVAMSIGAQPAPGQLSGTLRQLSDGAGLATFPDLAIDWLGEGYTLVAVLTSPDGTQSAIVSDAFDELRVGDPCLAPTPACSSGCPDRDGDGLNDAWETAHGIDMNGDGVIDASHDLVLEGSDPDRPDVYLKYDYMVAGDHDHAPPPLAVQWVVDAFAAHGVALHVDPVHDPIPEVRVTTLDPSASSACAGDDFVTMKTLRSRYFGNRGVAYHYMVFAHYSTTPDAAHVFACPEDALCKPAKPTAGATGSSDLPGNDVIVSFGQSADEGTAVGVETMASTIMHELGHNFGLKHGADDACTNWKPNYMSVMNYLYQSSAIPVADFPASANIAACTTDADCAPPRLSTGACATPGACHCTDDYAASIGTDLCFRIDYSGVRLLGLNELALSADVGGLDENVGVGGPPGSTDVVQYYAPGDSILLGPSFGPIDWNADGAIASHVTADIDNSGGYTFISTRNDWELSAGRLANFNFAFQCVATDRSGGKRHVTNEMTLGHARELRASRAVRGV